jgi:hypothetical protein
VTVAGVTLTAGSLIFATLQAFVTSGSTSAVVAVAAVVPDTQAGAFTIYLTAPVSVSVEIAWFVIG